MRQLEENSTPDRNAVPEEAAKVAEGMADERLDKRQIEQDDEGFRTKYQVSRRANGRDIAAAIRALKTTTPETKP